MKRLFIILGLLVCCGIAYSENNGDCYNVFGTNKSIEDIIKNYESKIAQTSVVKKEEIQTALENLKASCCKEKKLSDVVCAKKTESFGFSLFLIDHLIDVGFRKLDGKIDLIYNQKYSNDDVWKKAVAWRSYISQQSQKLSGGDPQELEKNFFEKRGDYDVKNISTTNLGGLYNFVCFDSVELVNDFKLVSNDKSDNVRNKVQICQQMAQDRYNLEYFYVQTIKTLYGKRQIITKTKDYNKYINDRLVTLFEKFVTMYSLLSEIVHKVKPVKDCN